MHRTVMVILKNFIGFCYLFIYLFWILALDALEKSKLSVLEQCGVEMDT